MEITLFDKNNTMYIHYTHKTYYYWLRNMVKHLYNYPNIIKLHIDGELDWKICKSMLNILKDVRFVDKNNENENDDEKNYTIKQLNKVTWDIIKLLKICVKNKDNLIIKQN